VKYAWIREHVAAFSVTAMCCALKVSTSGYYHWRDSTPSARQLRHDVLSDAVKQSHTASKGIYGYRKIFEDIREGDENFCCLETVRTLMKEQGLRAKRSRKFTVTTDSKHTEPVAENILNQDFEAQQPNEKWVADITYIRTHEGWTYLAAVMDLFNRSIVGWATSTRIDTELTSQALHNAIQQHQPGKGLLHHSDRGVQYASRDYQNALKLLGITCSMSRKGNCWDNACIERFFNSLKGEWIGDTIYTNHEAAHSAIFEYIETFYNTRRRHQALDYKTPMQYTMDKQQHEKTAA
jgi:putative transposase